MSDSFNLISSGGEALAGSSTSTPIEVTDREALRARRVAALGGSQETVETVKRVETTREDFHLHYDVSQYSAPFDSSSFHDLLWDTSFTTESDKERWYNQGIHTAALVEDTSQEEKSLSTVADMDLDGSREVDLFHAQWGLVQSQGGPCGVLAAIQAEMIRRLDFDWDNKDSVTCTVENVKECLALGLGTILARCALMDTVNDNGSIALTDSIFVQVVLPKKREKLSFTDIMDPTCDKLEAICISCVPQTATTTKSTNTPRSKRAKNEQVQSNQQREQVIEQLSINIKKVFLKDDASLLSLLYGEGGVLLFVMSLVGSRGVHRIRAEMDDPQNRLTSQFGHSSQELINLLLTGQCTSNVFDNTVKLGPLSMYGIQYQPAIGYLTQLESLRYCSVGGYYKNPQFPIWVIGSQSHFTVLFGSEKCLEESPSDLLLEKCRRAFKAIEGGEENGFIGVKDLSGALKSLDLMNKLGTHEVESLAAFMEVHGAGIILWDSFWKAVSRLLTGASLHSILQGNDGIQSNTFSGDKYGERTRVSSSDNNIFLQGNAFESDEEMAKRLTVEWEIADQPPEYEDDTVPNYDMTKITTRQQTDEEYARELQTQFAVEANTELNVGASSTSAIQGDNVALENGDLISHGVKSPIVPSSIIFGGSSCPQDSVGGRSDNIKEDFSTKNLNFETMGNSFVLHHYNGFRQGILTSFQVTRLSSNEAVGGSVPLSNTQNDAGSCVAVRNQSSIGGNLRGGGDLEDVVRTKYPSCTFHWFGKQPPIID